MRQVSPKSRLTTSRGNSRLRVKAKRSPNTGSDRRQSGSHDASTLSVDRGQLRWAATRQSTGSGRRGLPTGCGPPSAASRISPTAVTEGGRPLRRIGWRMAATGDPLLMDSDRRKDHAPTCQPALSGGFSRGWSLGREVPVMPTRRPEIVADSRETLTPLETPRRRLGLGVLASKPVAIRTITELSPIDGHLPRPIQGVPTV